MTPQSESHRIQRQHVRCYVTFVVRTCCHMMASATLHLTSNSVHCFRAVVIAAISSVARALCIVQRGAREVEAGWELLDSRLAVSTSLS